MNTEDLKIHIILKSNGSILGNATISVNTYAFGFITIKDFTLWKSHVFNERLQDYINITPPIRNTFGKYIERVFLENPQKWYELELAIFEAYNAELDKQAKDIPI